MAATSTTPEHPLTAKTLIYDLPSQTLSIDASHSAPVPDPSKNDHLVHVKTTALCTRELLWPAQFPIAIFAENPEKLITPGYDLAGTIVKAPPASPFKPGDEIYACTLMSRPGNYREYTIARTEEMALKPQKLNWEEAATVPLSAITAWQALFEHAGLKGLDNPNTAGKRILITAAAGGVGVWLVQLASIAGLEVVAQVGSARNDEFVRGLRASETVNYKMESLQEWAKRKGTVDIVIDCIGGMTLEDAWFCVKDGGTLISIVEPPEEKRPEELKEKVVKNEFFIMKPNGQQLAEVSKLLDQGHCRAVLDSVWNFEDYNKAFERLDTGHANGKVVIKVTG
jgi:NADPH:quinone reductase-like Zn-dependent oxidoreductase